MANPIIGVIMGSESDMDIMQQAVTILTDFAIGHEVRIVSAHRTPDVMEDYAASAQERGLQVIIAGAGGSAHLPGMTASHTPIPVIAVPIKRAETDHEALWSNIKMPPGIALATMPENSAKNAALFAIEILALHDETVAKKYAAFRKQQHDDVIAADHRLQA